MTVWIRDLLRLAGWFPGLSLAAVAFSFAAALLEGVGLAALIPVIQRSLQPSMRNVDAFTTWLPQDSERAVLLGISAFVLLTCVALLSRFLSETLLLKLRAAIEQQARERLTTALLQVSWPSFLELRIGDVTQAQFTEGIQMGNAAQLLVQSLGSFLACIGYLAIAFSISPQLTLYTLLFGGLVVFLYRALGGAARRHSDDMTSSAASIGERLAELFHALKFIRATGLTPYVKEQISDLYGAWKRSYIGSQFHAIALRHGFEFLGLAFVAAFLLLSLRPEGDGVAVALVFLGLFFRLAPRLLAVQESAFRAHICHSWYLSWRKRLDTAENDADIRDGTQAPTFLQRIELNNVTYRYPGSNHAVLHGVTQKIGAHETLGIIGLSGSGKTTLLDLLTGLLQPTTGAVLVDGKDLRTTDLQAWRRGIGLVLQDSCLVHGTLLENVTWGDAAIDTELARWALGVAGLSTLVGNLANGLDTPLGESGGRLSGGQRQRLALARALYRKPRLLILDEPTSALDTETQNEVLDALRTIKGRCAIVVVTHSPEVAALCDRVIRLDHGSLAVANDHFSCEQAKAPSSQRSTEASPAFPQTGG